MNIASIFLFACLTFFTSLSNGAVITTYTDRGMFLANAGSTITETFNAIQSADFRTSPYDFGVFTAAGGGSSQLDFNQLVSNPSNYSVDGSPLLHLITRVDENGNVLADVTFVFDQAITAFGGDFVEFNNGTPRSYIRVADTRVDPPIFTLNGYHFYGFISDVPFTTLAFSGIYIQGQADQFRLDNLTFSYETPSRDVSSVPLPPTLLLFLSSFIGSCILRVRRTL